MSAVTVATEGSRSLGSRSFISFLPAAFFVLLTVGLVLCGAPRQPELVRLQQALAGMPASTAVLIVFAIVLGTVALTRLRCHDETRAYAARRTSEGKTHREIKRSLKRAIARRLYRLMQATSTSQPPTAVT
jgi:hypothetical protein